MTQDSKVTNSDSTAKAITAICLIFVGGGLLTFVACYWGNDRDATVEVVSIATDIIVAVSTPLAVVWFITAYRAQIAEFSETIDLMKADTYSSRERAIADSTPSFALVYDKPPMEEINTLMVVRNLGLRNQNLAPITISRVTAKFVDETENFAVSVSKVSNEGDPITEITIMDPLLGKESYPDKDDEVTRVNLTLVKAIRPLKLLLEYSAAGVENRLMCLTILGESTVGQIDCKGGRDAPVVRRVFDKTDKIYLES